MHLRVVFDSVRPGRLAVDFNVLLRNNDLPATYRRGKSKPYMWCDSRLMEQLSKLLLAEGTGVYATRFHRQQLVISYKRAISEAAIKDLVLAVCQAESDFVQIAA